MILYFHGNGEDIGTSYALCDKIRTTLGIGVLAVEYPSYGVYEDREGPSEKKILNDAELVFKFVRDVAELNER